MSWLISKNLIQTCWKSYKDIGNYNIRYIAIKKIDDYENIYSVNPLYLTISHASKYIEEKDVNKYLAFDSMKLHSKDENKELLKKYNDVFNGIRKKKQVVMNVTVKKIIWKLNLIQMMICH